MSKLRNVQSLKRFILLQIGNLTLEKYHHQHVQDQINCYLAKIKNRSFKNFQRQKKKNAQPSVP